MIQLILRLTAGFTNNYFASGTHEFNRGCRLQGQLQPHCVASMSYTIFAERIFDPLPGRAGDALAGAACRPV